MILSLIFTSSVSYTVHSFTEVHPLVSGKNKDKPAMAGGKKVTAPSRPRNSDGKRFERSRSGK